MAEIGDDEYELKQESFERVIDKSITVLITLIEGNDDDQQTIKLLCDNIEVHDMKAKLKAEFIEYVDKCLYKGKNTQKNYHPV